MDSQKFRVKILGESGYSSLESKINQWLLDEGEKIDKIVNVSLASEWQAADSYCALILYQPR